MSQVGVVIIGRNEGERLRRCLESASGAGAPILLYVDSGSSDDSVALARSLGAEVVELDMRTPFTAARARNAGFARLLEIAPDVTYVQFVDGDCELVPRWLETAQAALAADASLAAVCGRLRERYPERSVYNRLCDIEWAHPAGEATACGGIAMFSASAFNAVGGFRADLIAGEEEELCARLRERGGRILRLAEDMALHDAAMYRASQWWKRMVRAGHAYAQVSAMHSQGLMGHWRHSLYSIVGWGALLPALTVLFACSTHGASFLSVLLYVMLTRRVYRHTRARAFDAHDAFWYALSCVIGKFPQAIGVARYYVDRALARAPRIIEYK